MLTPAEIFRESSQWTVRLVAADVNKSVLGAGSGFISRGRIVTCGHNISKPTISMIEVMLIGTIWGENRFLGLDIKDRILGFSDENSYDFAILDFINEREKFPGLELSDRIPEVGEPVVSLGFPLDDENLTLHQGVVAAVHKSGPATMLKLDMSVNAGNSGGPLISLIDGRVVGVVVRKATGLTKAFDQFFSVIDQNIALLSQPNMGGVSISGIDPIKVTLAQQQQLKDLAAQIQRSANVGIGYAIYVDPLRNENGLT